MQFKNMIYLRIMISDFTVYTTLYKQNNKKARIFLYIHSLIILFKPNYEISLHFTDQVLVNKL